MADDLMIYMIGEPGAGKSTLMARLTEPWERFVATGQPRRDLLLEGETIRAVELGKRRAGGFSGTDALGSSVITVAERWLYQHEAPIVLGEGARLANARWLKAGVDAGYRVTLVLLAPLVRPELMHHRPPSKISAPSPVRSRWPPRRPTSGAVSCPAAPRSRPLRPRRGMPPRCACTSPAPQHLPA